MLEQALVSKKDRIGKVVIGGREHRVAYTGPSVNLGKKIPFLIR
jgi:hypothetical protein